jgi:hypothetical protein
MDVRLEQTVNSSSVNQGGSDRRNAGGRHHDERAGGCASQRYVKLSRAQGSLVPDDLEARLKRSQRADFEKRASYQVDSVVNISFPMLDGHGEAIAALTVPCFPRLNMWLPDVHVVMLCTGSGVFVCGSGIAADSGRTRASFVCCFRERVWGGR